MKTYTLLAALLITAILKFASCSDAGVQLPYVPDTTSHNFVWQPPVFPGDGGGSLLRDVCIVNENLAYAVGTVYAHDSLGNWDPLPYNLVKWDGSSWQLRRVSVSHLGSVITPPLYGIFAFSESDIWLSSGVPIHGDGSQWQQFHLFDLGVLGQNDGSLKKIWGADVSSIYFVGNRGTIVHYTNGTWQKLESGTAFDITDIYGARSASTNNLEILAVASRQYQSLERKILRIRDLTVEALPDTPITQPLTTCWFVPGVRYFVAGSGIYEKTSLDDPLWQHGSRDIATYYIEAIRGAASNDLVAVGDFGEVLHYSGRTWKSYLGQTHIASGAYYAVAMKGNAVLAVGEDSPRAVILMGFRFPM